MGGVQRVIGGKSFRFFSWAEFDYAVRLVADKILVEPSMVIRGEHRGGLPLAVALSHRLNIPMIGGRVGHGYNSVLWVDDIIDTGTSLEIARSEFKNVKFLAAVMVTKRKPQRDTIAAYYVVPESWVVFPWENSERIIEERAEFASRRGLEVSNQ